MLHKSLITGPGLNSSPLEVKNPPVFHGSATAFHYLDPCLQWTELQMWLVSPKDVLFIYLFIFKNLFLKWMVLSEMLMSVSPKPEHWDAVERPGTLSLLTTVLTSQLQEFLPHSQHSILQVMGVILNELEIVNFVDFANKMLWHNITLQHESASNKINCC